MALTNAERQRNKRARKIRLGLKKIEVWVLPEDERKVRKLEKESQKKAIEKDNEC